MGKASITDNQAEVWDNNWESTIEVDPHDILYSRFAREAYACLKAFIGEIENTAILEAGCGTGRLCCLLAMDIPHSNITGIDVSENAIRTANHLKQFFKIPNVSFQQEDLFSIPFPDEYFDIVFNEGVIEHFSMEDNPNFVDAVKEMVRVTKKGGKVIAAVPNWYSLPHTTYKWALKSLGKEYRYGYEKSFRHAELLTLFLNAGLRNPRIKGFYAGHCFYRFSGGGWRKTFELLGKLTDFFQSLLTDRLKSRFQARFGIEIMIAGTK